MRRPDPRLVPDTGTQVFDPVLVERFLNSRNSVPDEVQLENLRVLRLHESGELRATVAGILRCTRHPEEYIGGAVIEAVRCEGTVLRNSGRYHDTATITGPLDVQIRDAPQFVRRNTWMAGRKDPGRVETPQFDPRTVFEGIVNAVLHRDYEVENRRIRLWIFDDRLELYSPGGLPTGWGLSGCGVTGPPATRCWPRCFAG